MVINVVAPATISCLTEVPSCSKLKYLPIIFPLVPELLRKTIG
jgi:hypothetical protein